MTQSLFAKWQAHAGSEVQLPKAPQGTAHVPQGLLDILYVYIIYNIYIYIWGTSSKLAGVARIVKFLVFWVVVSCNIIRMNVIIKPALVGLWDVSPWTRGTLSPPTVSWGCDTDQRLWRRWFVGCLEGSRTNQHFQIQIYTVVHTDFFQSKKKLIKANRKKHQKTETKPNHVLLQWSPWVGEPVSLRGQSWSGSLHHLRACEQLGCRRLNLKMTRQHQLFEEMRWKHDREIFPPSVLDLHFAVVNKTHTLFQKVAQNICHQPSCCVQKSTLGARLLRVTPWFWDGAASTPRYHHLAMGHARNDPTTIYIWLQTNPKKWFQRFWGIQT